MAIEREMGSNWERQSHSVGGRSGSGHDSGVNVRALRDEGENTENGGVAEQS